MNEKSLNRSVDYIKSWLKFRFEQEEVPGLVVAIAHKGKVIMSEAHGYADVEKKVKMTSDHIFRIASHSKTFTATAIMQLQEQGKLRIDDYAADYLDWLKDHKDARWQKVTIRQLLSHGAGVIRDGLDSDYWQLERPFPDDVELKKEVLKAKLVIENNTKLKYSNFGYSLLGMLIAVVSGQSYNDYVTEHIVRPLRLQNTGPEYKDAIKDNIVTGYTRPEADKTRLPIAHADTRAMAAATGFYATAEDLCTYFAAHFVGSGKLLDNESKKEMQRVQWHAKTPGQSNHEDYGLGMELEYLGKRVTISHGGGFPGHITKTIADSKDDLVVVVLTNCLSSPATGIAKNIFHIFDYYQNNTTHAKPKHDLAKFEGRFMNLWSVVDIVATGNKLVAIYPGGWQPFAQPEELEYKNEKTLEVTATSSFSSESELIHFDMKDGKIATINYCGATMWPEEVWKKKQKQRKIVSLP